MKSNTPTIIVGNSYSQIVGMSAEEEKRARKALSYFPDPKAAYYSGGYSKPICLINKKGFFMSGLLPILMGTIKNAYVIDKRTRPKSVPGMFALNNSVKPYEWQDSAANIASTMDRGGIQAVTGSGKSLLIALIASRLNVRTLVVVPSLEIKKQLQDSFKSLFGDNDNISVENIDSSILKMKKDFDCLIVDEGHHSAAKTYRMLNKTVWNDVYYRFFLTATFYRNQEHEKLLFEGIAGELIYKLTYKEAVNKYVVPVEAFYVNVPKQPTDAYTWGEVYKELVTNNDARNSMISRMLSVLKKEKVPTLCLVKEIHHGEILSEMSGVLFSNGKDEESRKYISDFNKGKITCLIGTTGILGEGIDTKPAEYVLIAGLGKAKSSFMQNVGRGLRKHNCKESAKIIIFRDTSHKYTLRHFNTQKKILLDEFGITVVELESEGI
jgi:superfamily II DNA or RNA helicase